jgi:RND family efflux transporter MFP subunit
MRKFGFLAVVLAGLSLALTASAADAAAGAASTVTAAVVVKPAVKTTIARQVTGVGTVGSNPNAVLSVNAPFAAIVGQLFVRAGEAVTKGQKLVALQTTPAQSAAYAQAQAAVTYAQGELARQEHLLRQQLATHAQVAQARNALADAEAKLQALQSVGAGNARSVLTASAAGTVTAVSAQAGQHLAEGANILTLAPSSALVVRLGVEPERADAVRIGTQVKLHDALDPTETRQGTVESVSATVDSKTRLRDVLVSIQKQAGTIDPPLAVGTYMHGSITLGRAQVIAVPPEAILLDNKGKYLFVVRNGTAHRVDVITGPENDQLVGVSGAIEAGASVVVQGNYELTDGMHVRVVSQ